MRLIIAIYKGMKMEPKLQDELTEMTSSFYGRLLPRRIESSQFRSFVTRADSFAAAIYSRKLKTTVVQFRFDYKATSAYTEGRDIYMPALYLSHKFYESLYVEPEFHAEAAIACINGSQIHEALHLVHTDFEAFGRWNAGNKDRDLGKYAGQIFSIANVIEDLFIENSADVTTRGYIYEQLLRLKNMVLFNAPLLEGAIEKLAIEPSVENFINLIVFLKREDLRDIVFEVLAANPVTALAGEELAVCLPLLVKHVPLDDKISTTYDRIMLAVDIFQLLRKDGAEPEAGSDMTDEIAQLMSALFGEDSGEGSGEEDEDDDDYDSPRNMRISELIKKLIEGLGGEEEMNRLAKALNEVSEEVELEVARAQRIRTGADVATDSLKAKYVDILENPDKSPSSFLIKPEPKWKDFAAYLKYAMQERHAPLIPSDENGSLVSANIARIATDGRILGQGAPKRQRGIPEFIILLDMSGSMTGATVTRGYKTLIQEAASAAYGLFKSCEQGRIPVAVYGHTSCQPNYSPCIYTIAANQMPLKTRDVIQVSRGIEERFAAIANVNCSVNFDGIIINEVRKRFTTRPGSKVLLVISDGEPSGNMDYDGLSARNHTIAMIESARKAGVIVFSLSVTSSVVNSNDKIYRPGFNIDASKGNLTDELRKLITGMSGLK
jgi:hypothetical protein